MTDLTHTRAASLADHLVEAIISGELAPGAKLSEPELARRYDVSRGPLREAILRLEGMGLVTRRPNVGARVITLTVEDVRATFAVREALEGMAARLACENAAPEELSGLEALMTAHEREMAGSAEKHYARQEGHYDFHSRILGASHNPQLAVLLGQDLYPKMRMYRQQTSDHRVDPRQALREHQAITDALCNREPDLAELLMRRHISRSCALLVAYLQQNTAGAPVKSRQRKTGASHA